MAGVARVRRVGAVTRWLALAASEPARNRRQTRWIQGLAVVAAACGAAGWIQQDRNDPTIDLDLAALAYRTAALFAIDTSGAAQAPWTLDLARLLAPLATASVGVAVVLSALQTRLHRRVAKGSTEHRVVLGPPVRVKQQLAGIGTVVHADAAEHRPERDVVFTKVDWGTAAWIEETGVRNALEVTIDTGDDARNLVLLGQLGTKEPRVVRVAVDDPISARWLSVALAVRSSAADVSVACRSTAAAAAAAADVGEVLALSGGRRPIVLVGSGARFVDAVEHAAAAASAWQLASSMTTVPSVYVVGPESVAVAGRFTGIPHRVQVRPISDLDALESTVGNDVAAVFVLDDTPGAVVTQAMEARARWPEALVYAREAGALEAAGVVPLREATTDGDGFLDGPFAAAARARHDRPRGVAAGLADWKDMDRQQRVRAVRAIRLAIAELATIEGHDVGPAPIGHRPTFLPRRVVDDIAVGGSAANPDLVALPYWLRDAGLSVTRSDATVPASVATPDDDLVELLAEASHQSYYAHARSQDPTHPAAEPWDSLDPGFKAQNRDQGRHSYVSLARLGYTVVPATGAGRRKVTAFETAELEQLARWEHDRWSEVKWAQGHRLCAPGTRGELEHPDLEAWEDLDGPEDERREKDRGPFRELPARLAAHGLAIVRGA